jgi:carbamoyltransferase
MAIRILGISAFYHDSAAALLQDGRVVAAAQEERFTRKKHDDSFPKAATLYVLDEGGIGVEDLDAVVFYDKPMLKFERLLETYHALAPHGMKSFGKAMPLWLKDKLFLRKLLRRELALPPKIPVLFPEHHLSHAASAFYPSPFEQSAILTLDGVGEWATTTLGCGSGREISLYKEQHFPHSLGLLYSAFTYYLGFRVNSGEYKVMGLAPYGIADSAQTKDFVKAILNHLIDLREDGSFLLNMAYFDFAAGLTMTRNEKWTQLFGLPPRTPESEITPAHMNLASAIQQVTNQVVLQLAKEVQKESGSPNLVMSGGVALNCVANRRIAESGLFENIWIQPASGDAGGALGAAYAAYHLYFEQPRSKEPRGDAMQGALLGPAYGSKEIEKVLRRHEAPFQYIAHSQELASRVARQLADGKVIGWFQGRMEFGPRALGNRSILGDPRNPEMQRKINLKIKFREAFRPFAPSVLAEDAPLYFDLKVPSPYMLFTAPVKESFRIQGTIISEKASWQERLYQPRSSLPAITHVDFSARIQWVYRETNPLFWELLQAFKALTGIGLLVNTSFNVRGEPIVCTPEDAYRCFMQTEMDYLVLGNYLLDRRDQPRNATG